MKPSEVAEETLKAWESFRNESPGPWQEPESVAVARAYLRLREAVLRYKRDGSMKHLGELWKALEETDD
jgi:hypothetical protein